MGTFVIDGGTPLYGSVRLGGAKNASFKLMVASLLTNGQSRLLNFSHIADVNTTREIIEDLGGTTRNAGERTMFIDTSTVHSHVIPQKYGKLSRASTLFLGPLLARFGEAVVPFPGGDAIGSRPIERHLEGLRALGAELTVKSDRIEATCKRLVGTTYEFSKNTHTGTETLLLAAVLAKGTTVLKNAALEPEVDDLIEFLNNMGARIRRRMHKIIEIEGVKTLNPTIHRIMPDRNEAVSYACAAIATKGDIIVENARRDHLEAFLQKLDEVGGGYEIGNYGIRFYYKQPLRAADIKTVPHPGFMTDWQPLWAVLMTQAKGESEIFETVSSNRFQYISAMKEMGVDVSAFIPKVDDPEQTYNFNLDEDKPEYIHAIKIHGPSKLKAGTFTVHDLRAGATIVLSALTAKGKTVLHNIEEIDRGYEKLDERLRSMGAHIERLT